MHRGQAQLRTGLLVAADLSATAAGLAIAYFLRFGLIPVTKPWTPGRYLEALPVTVLLCVATFAVLGTYRLPTRESSRRDDLRSAVGGVLAAALLLAAGALFYRERYQYSRGVLLLFPVAGVPLLWFGRRMAGRALLALQAKGVGVRRALVVGDGPRREELEGELAARRFSGVRVVGRAAGPDDLPRAIREHRAVQVFLVYPADAREDLARALSVLEDEMVDVRVVPDLPPSPGLNREVWMVGDLPVVSVRQTPFFGVNRLLKRSFDLFGSAVLLVVLSPVLLLTALAVLVLTGRPVLYLQERMGLDGKRFRIIKLRTMRRDAEEASGATWARAGDPRRTPLGRLLRRLSLDELPQLVNVLKGEMSLVGPRPERPVFIESFRKRLPSYMLRHRIPAGLTGWAQVQGHRGDTDVAARLRADLFYLERWSLLLDVEILLRTIWHVLSGRNAV